MLVLDLQEELGRCCDPFRTWGDNNTAMQEDLGKRQELQLHAECLFIHALYESPCHVFEEGQDQLAPRGLALVGSVLLTCKCLILGDVEDNGEKEPTK